VAAEEDEVAVDGDKVRIECLMLSSPFEFRFPIL